MLDALKALSPKDDNQRFLKQQCLNLEVQLGRTRWLMYAQNTVPFPRFLLVMLIAWLTVLFVSFGIFAPRNPLVLAGLFVSAAGFRGVGIPDCVGDARTQAAKAAEYVRLVST